MMERILNLLADRLVLHVEPADVLQHLITLGILLHELPIKLLCVFFRSDDPL